MEANMGLNQKRKKKPMIISVIIVSILGVILCMGLEFSKVYHAPGLVGIWLSNETGKEVEFTGDGNVIVDKIKTGMYVVTSTGCILYDIEGHTFEMAYKIHGRELLWGIKEEEEMFTRKGL